MDKENVIVISVDEIKDLLYSRSSEYVLNTGLALELNSYKTCHGHEIINRFHKYISENINSAKHGICIIPVKEFSIVVLRADSILPEGKVAVFIGAKKADDKAVQDYLSSRLLK